MTSMTLLILLACSKPQPPTPARAPNTMDTASYVEDEAERPSVGVPRIKSVLLLGAATSSDPARVEIDAVDPDGGSLRYSYRWFVNDRPVTGQTQATLAASFYKKDDRLSCLVEARNGYEKASKRSNERVVGNLAPVIDMKRMRLDKLDGLQITASDPDGDSLSYSLADAPPGMTIDSDGRLHYSGSKDQTEGGQYRPRVTVTDSNGESVVWDFEVNLTGGKGDEKLKRSQLPQ